MGRGEDLEWDEEYFWMREWNERQKKMFKVGSEISTELIN